MIRKFLPVAAACLGFAAAALAQQSKPEELPTAPEPQLTAKAAPVTTLAGGVVVERAGSQPLELSIDDAIAHSIADGCDRVLNLAAGLDTRPYRMDLPADFTWVEADLAPLLKEKTDLLADQTPRCRLRRAEYSLLRQQVRAARQAKIRQIAHQKRARPALGKTRCCGVRRDEARRNRRAQDRQVKADWFRARAPVSTPDDASPMRRH